MELTDKLITAYLDSIHLLRLRAPESEDAKNVQQKVASYLYDLNLRELSEEAIKKIASEIQSSKVLSWFFTRMIVATRATSINPNRIDQFIANTLTFFPLSKMENEYAGDSALKSVSDVIAKYNTFQFMKIIALFELLNIHQEIEYRRTVSETP